MNLKNLKINRIKLKKEIIKKSNVDKIIDESIQIIEKTIEACVERYKVFMPITGGLDSRVLLAASKKYE